MPDLPPPSKNPLVAPIGALSQPYAAAHSDPLCLGAQTGAGVDEGGRHFQRGGLV